ncbi:MAG: ATP-grasp domain-containing protein [Candidatus Altiarchaeota archaeon]|nr:ATP-grasp domain-containing protein [Candidatus Altiarchaeota archaeon]
MDEIGIVGINSRAAADSARSLGLKVYLVDYFDDVDVKAERRYSLQSEPLKPNLEVEYTSDKLVDAAIEKLGGEVSSLITTSDIGCNPRLIEKLEKHFTVLGNNSGQVKKAKNWRTLKKALDEEGIRHPKTETARSTREIEKKLGEIKTPAVVKGVGIQPRLIRGLEDMEGLKDLRIEDEALIQEYIKGVEVSASVMADAEKTTTLSVNRQLVGIDWLFAKEMAYCGNIVPLDSMYDEKIAEKSAGIIDRLGLIGSNGVDYIISEDGLYFMEVNTRLQDTLECVEKYRGINMVREHLKALEGNTDIHGKAGGCYGKGILYARERLRVEDLRRIDGVKDIPQKDSTIRINEPVCSIYASGNTHDEVLEKLREKANLLDKHYKIVTGWGY